MGTKAVVMTGARAILYVNNIAVGMFDSCNYSKSIGVEEVYTLGKYSAQEITPTSASTVSLNCSGFRIIDTDGSKKTAITSNPKFPKLQDLLNLENFTIHIVDRQSAKTILKIKECTATSHSGSLQSRANSRFQINYVGISEEDESSEQSEIGATSLV